MEALDFVFIKRGSSGFMEMESRPIWMKIEQKSATLTTSADSYTVQEKFGPEINFICSVITKLKFLVHLRPSRSCGCAKS